MKKNIKFESYNKQIEAIPYTKGMEDGYVRCAVENGHREWIPYIVSNNVQILLGEKYWLVKEGNNLYGLSDENFKSWIENKELK